MDSGKKSRTRWGYLAASIIIFIIELIIALYVHDRIIRPYIGDMLVVVLVYCFVRVFVPGGVKRLPLYVFFFAVFVEVMQYFRLAEILGLQGNAVARIILGSVFDWKDIACYGAGCLLIQYLKF
ncbi:MAG: DUF2809 domain-containing protein [Clostridia bacterium]|nr:DUF2809 domain-containing protein [Clostridia bacterium]